MIVGHAYPVAELNFEPPRTEYVDTRTGRDAVRIPGKKIRFKRIRPGIPTDRIRTRRVREGNEDITGRLLSQVNTEDVSKELGVEEEDLIAWFREHPSFEKTFIFVDEDMHVYGNSTGYGDGIEANGDGSFVCRFCDNKYFKNAKGIEQHCASPRHQNNREARRPEQVEVPL